MEIKQASIYGFGKWVHYDITFTRGMCIYGQNESGKSTIHQFILFMLFGLPPKQRAAYQPKMGAQLGGRMTLYDEKIGEFTIERLDHVKNGAAVCYTPDGREYDEAWLKDQLNGTTLGTYQSIFSFSAMDLSEITSMSETDLSEMILGIGLTGSTEIYHLEKQLENKLGELFKPYGTKPKMNQLLDQLEKRYAALRSYKENEATYREKKLRELQLEEKRQQLDKEWQKEKQHVSSLDRYMQALPILNDYRQSREQLQQHDKDIAFPEQGVARLEKWKTSLLPLQSELAILCTNEEKYKKKIEELKSRLVTHEQYETIEKLIQEKEVYLVEQRELNRMEHMIHSKKIELEKELERLNIGLELEALIELQLPYHIEKKWTELKKATEQVTLEEEKLIHEVQELKQERKALYHRLEAVEEHVLSDEHVVALNEMIDQSREWDVAQRLQEDAEKQQKSWNQKRQEKEKSMQYVLFGSFGLTILLAIIGFITTIDWLPIVGFAVLLFGVGQWIVGRKTLKDWDEWKLVALSTSQHAYSKEEIDDAEMKLWKHQKHVTEMENLKERLEKNDLKKAVIREKMKNVESKDQKVSNERNAQIRDYPFLQMVDISYWPEFFHALKQLVTSAKWYIEKLKERENFQKRVDSYRSKVSDFFASYDWEHLDSIEQQLKKLELFIIEQQEIASEVKRYANFLIENREEQQKVRKRMETFEQEIKALWRLANVESEEAYYVKAREIEERNQLETALKASHDQLERIFPNGSWQIYLSQQDTEHELEIRRKESEKRVQRLEKELMEIEKEFTKLESQLEIMESETNYSDHLHQFELEQEEWKELAKQWTILKVAKDLLQQTKQVYQEKHLQHVLEKTANYFEVLTGGRYRKIFSPVDGKGFQVESSEGLRFGVRELSKGTMDQLYVSLRIAIGQVLSEKSQLPFIIDDAFLHFDSVRTKRMMEILEEIARSRQVILFTCKEDVAHRGVQLETVDLENSIRII